MKKNKYPIIFEGNDKDGFWFYLDGEKPASYTIKDVIIDPEDFKDFMLNNVYAYIKKQNRNLYKVVEEYEKTMINSK